MVKVKVSLKGLGACLDKISAVVTGDEVKAVVMFTPALVDAKKGGVYKGTVSACNGTAQVSAAFAYELAKGCVPMPEGKPLGVAIVCAKQLISNIGILQASVSEIAIEVGKQVRLACANGTYIDMPVFESANASLQNEKKMGVQLKMNVEALKKAVSRGGFLAKKENGKAAVTGNITIQMRDDMNEMTVMSLNPGGNMHAMSVAKVIGSKVSAPEGAGEDYKPKTVYSLSGENLRKVVSILTGNECLVGFTEKQMAIAFSEGIVNIVLSTDEMNEHMINAIKTVSMDEGLCRAYVSKEDLIASCNIISTSADIFNLEMTEDQLVMTSVKGSAKAMCPAEVKGGAIVSSYANKVVTNALSVFGGDVLLSFVEQKAGVYFATVSQLVGEDDKLASEKEVSKTTVVSFLPVAVPKKEEAKEEEVETESTEETEDEE